jgi:lipoprotein-anchoring transpeptidase ErfK/SrfK
MSFILNVNIKQQMLHVIKNNQIIRSYLIGTGKKGLGEQKGSEKTPRGWHKIRAKIGANQAENTVFVGRRPTGEIYNAELRAQHPDRDWILTRILWLSGLEPGFNRLGDVDTMRRFIYIHGCPDDHMLGFPSSHGCIKMRNEDVIELFDMIPVGTKILIQEK